MGFIKINFFDFINDAYLNKDVYDKKREYASNKMLKNKEIKTLTDEQHSVLAELCSIRHKLHTNMDKVVKSDDQKIKQSIVLVNVDLNNSGLEPMSFIGIDPADYIDIDTIDELYEFEDVPEDDEGRQDWYDSNYQRIYSELEELNGKIEEYLSKIDKKYGTDYCPSGMSRNF